MSEQILRAAFKVLVEYGADSLTMRRIALECGTESGNLRYYYPSKDELVRELLNAIVGSYEDQIDEIMRDSQSNSEQRLIRIISLVLRDITSKETTRIFPELWAMANHDAYVEERLDEMYQRGRAAITTLIMDINPDLPSEEAEALAVFIQASMEGLTIFAGHEKSWCERMPWMERISITSFLYLTKTLRPGQIKQHAK